MAATNIQTFAGQVEVNSNLTVATDTLHVDSVSGRVGVGKTDPAYKLDVNGTLNATALYVGGSEFVSGFWTESGSNIYYTGGNVGIGTTTAPQKTLEIAGPMRITDGLSNVCDFSVGTGTNTWDTGTKIVASDAQGIDQFGISVAIDGDYAIVGAFGDGDGGSVSGSAYIFRRTGTNTWDSGTKIVASDAEAYDQFGFSVGISGDYAIVGANLDDGPAGTPQPTNYGAAYIFRRIGTNTWDTGTKIVATDAQGIDQFGFSVGISGDYAIVGARYEDDGAASGGSAYIFRRTGENTWDAGTKIVASDAAQSDQFGFSVGISGDYAIVGAIGDDRPGQPTNDNAGSAYIFRRTGTNTWDAGTKIVASDAAPTDQFGWSVGISGDYAIVGAPYDDGPAGTPQPDYGAAYIFRRTGTNEWDTGTKIVASDAAPTDYFGNSVAISGDYAIAGAPGDDDGGNLSGSAYIFRRTGTNTWDTGTKILASDAAAEDYFGRAVAIDGDYAIVGAPFSNDAGSNSGDAYIYKRDSLSLTVSTPITAAGTLLSFTGQHICFPEGPMSQGLVVSANKNKYVSLNGSLTTGTRAIKSSEALPVVSLSNVASDPSVFGVVDHFEQGGTTRSQKSGATVIRQDKELGDNRVIVNALGEGAIWVADTNGNVASGDFLTTSHLPGYAQRQDDPFRRNYTVAKSTMDCDFDPERIPVQIILKDEDDKNVLDSYGRLQWVDDPEGRTAPEYRIRYLDVSGTPTDEANAVHRAAFVGCTYHCG